MSSTLSTGVLLEEYFVVFIQLLCSCRLSFDVKLLLFARARPFQQLYRESAMSLGRLVFWIAPYCLVKPLYRRWQLLGW